MYYLLGKWTQIFEGFKSCLFILLWLFILCLNRYFRISKIWELSEGERLQILRLHRRGLPPIKILNALNVYGLRFKQPLSVLSILVAFNNVRVQKRKSLPEKAVCFTGVMWLVRNKKWVCKRIQKTCHR